jgi:bifunctional DNase/RNase
MDERALVEMSVVRVSPYLREDRPLLWLGEKDSEVPQLLPIAIGEFEAAAIQMPLEGEKPTRPISYDLLAAMLDKAGVTVSRIEIDSVRESVFFAKVVVQDRGQVRRIDSRPSDAVALALRTGAPIFADKDLLEEVGLKPDGSEEDMERFLERFHEMEPQVVEPPRPEVAPPVSPSGDHDPASEEEPASPLAELHSRLQQAVICEEYEEAARLRDQIEPMQGSHAE